jgi:hypothetical protein
MTDLSLDTISSLTGGFDGTYDVACPLCGPDRRSPANRRRKVLRIWIVDGFSTYCCQRCGEHGYVRDQTAARPDPEVLARIRAEAAERERAAAAERLSKAKWLWSQRRPLAGSIAEVYLRAARAYSGALPTTLGFLPPRGEHGPAMVAAFGLCQEPEPGMLHIHDVDIAGVHITRLSQDGSGKAGTNADKIMVGRSAGKPIILAPANDLLGLAITEGIEDALSVHQATGLGVWAAGCGSRMPPLADLVPSYVECVTIYAHADDTGQKGARKLALALADRVEVFVEGLLQ